MKHYDNKKSAGCSAPKGCRMDYDPKPEGTKINNSKYANEVTMLKGAKKNG